MERNLKKREFLEMDKPLAQNCYHAAQSTPELKHLVASYKDWLESINGELAALDG